MPRKAKTHRPWPEWMRTQAQQAKGREERSDDPHRLLYKLAEWRDPQVGLRAARLAAEPTCRECKKAGRVTPANEVDHVTPHRGDMALFLDYDNTASLCKRHHAQKTAIEVNERSQR